MIKLENIVKTFKDGDHVINAVDDVSINFPDKGMFFIIGKSGSGKSTLLYILGSLIKPDSGFIKRNYIANKESEIIKKTGFIFQNYNLFNSLTVKQNLEITRTIKNKKITDDEIKRLSSIFGIEQLLSKKVSNLSGGEQQRVAILRAVMNDSKIILADEPTGNLDAENAKLVYDKLKEISKERLVVCVTHDILAASQYSDHLIEMSSGKITSNSLTNTEKKEDTIIDEPLDNKKNGLSNIKLAFKFAHKHLYNKWLRLILTLISVSISSMLLVLTLSFFNYNTNKVISNYIKDYNIENHTLYESKSYIDLFNDKKNRNIYKGENFYNMLSKKFPEKNISKIKLEQLSSLLPEKINLNYYSKNLNVLLKDGKKPSKKNEILISDYLATTNSLNLNSEIKIYNNTYTISGITKTAFLENEYLKKKQFGKLSPIDIDIEKYEYLSVYIDINLNPIDDNNSFIINNNALMLSPLFKISESMNINISKYDSNITLIKGRAPLNDNEVVVSKYVAQNIPNLNKTEVIGKTFNFYNYNQDYFNNAYEDYFNMYDYYKSGIKVVGIVDDNTDNIYIDSQKYNTIKDKYYSYYYFDEFRIRDYKDVNTAFLDNLGENIYFSEPAINNIYHFSDTIKIALPILIALLVVFVILSLSMLITMFLNSFYLGKKDIAILQSLGLEKLNVIRIYIYQSLEMLLLSIVGLLGLYFLAIKGINLFFHQMIPFRKINIYLFDNFGFFISIFQLLVVSIIIMLFIIRKMLKTNIIQSLKTE